MKYTKAMRQADFHKSMERLGFTYEEADTLRRAQMTLHTWAERECNGLIERDEETGKVYSLNRNGDRTKYTVPDLETGAWKRVLVTVDRRNARESAASVHNTREALPNLVAYHQTDPRGCALYLVEGTPTDDVSAVYNRGFGVCY